MSLPEVLVGLVIAGLVSAALYQFFASQVASYSRHDDIAEIQQNLRIGLERISRDLAMAGFGKPTWSMINGNDLSDWYSSTNGYVPVNGGTTLDIVGCSAEPDGTVSFMELEVDSARMVLNEPPSVVRNKFNTSSRSDISIAGRENTKVTHIDQNTLTVKPRPTQVYTAGTQLFVVRHLTYSTGISGRTPSLFLDDHLGGHRQAICQFITGLEADIDGVTVRVKLTARGSKPNNKPFTSTISGAVTLRNR